MATFQDNLGRMTEFGGEGADAKELLRSMLQGKVGKATIQGGGEASPEQTVADKLSAIIGIHEAGQATARREAWPSLAEHTAQA
jgi:hypothetical protein